MCQRRDNEPWYSFWVRSMCEHPTATFCVATMVAYACLYSDLRTYLHEQTATLIKLNMQMEQVIRNTEK